MLAGCLAPVAWGGARGRPGDGTALRLQSPFTLAAALRFGLLFLALDVSGNLAQRALGSAGFYAVSLAGGLVSSASAVAAAATLAGRGALPPAVAGAGAVLASLTSVLVNLPLVARTARERPLTRRIALAMGGVLALGVFGALAAKWVPAPAAGP
jgi:uncharacterized membrane protein (DUF4010 family)